MHSRGDAARDRAVCEMATLRGSGNAARACDSERVGVSQVAPQTNRLPTLSQRVTHVATVAAVGVRARWHRNSTECVRTLLTDDCSRAAAHVGAGAAPWRGASFALLHHSAGAHHRVQGHQHRTRAD
eukprot:2517069-Pyramimonas_sp.AAC.1